MIHYRRFSKAIYFCLMPVSAGFMHSQTSGEARDPLAVLMVSDMCADLVVTGNVRPQFHQVEQIVGDYSLELEGSANIFASQMVKLGARVGVIGYVGRDIFGEFALRELQQIGVDITRVKKHPSNVSGKQRRPARRGSRRNPTAFLSALAYRQLFSFAKSPLLLAKLAAEVPACWYNHIARYRLGPGQSVGGSRRFAAHIDVFLPNEGEALAITGETDVGKAAKTIANMGPLTV
jgi:hypothetical protein